MMNWKVVLALMVTFALMMSSSYTMLIPFLPLYMQNELKATSDEIAMWSGFTFSVTFAVSAFMSPIWGKLSDKMGKKPMIIRSSILLSITYFLGGIVTNPFELFLVRAFQGIAAGLWPACLVMISAYAPKNKLGLSMGLMQSANICGGILGPLFGGILATSFGMRNSFFIGSTALFTICVLSIFILKEPPADKDIKKADNKSVSTMDCLKNINILILLLCVGLTNFAIMEIQPIMSLYVQSMAENAENAVLLSGLILSSGGLAGAIASPLWGKIGQKKGFAKTITVAFIFAGFMLTMQGIPDNLIIFGAIQFICGLGFSGIFPSANSILVLITPGNSRGIGFGLMTSAQMLGGALGPIIGGLIVTLSSYSYVYVFSGLLMLCMGIYILFFAPESFKKAANQVKVTDLKTSQD